MTEEDRAGLDCDGDCNTNLEVNVLVLVLRTLDAHARSLVWPWLSAPSNPRAAHTFDAKGR